MFLSNTLALFRPPVHLHVQAAPPASSSPTHNQPHHPSIHVSYFTSSFTSTPPEPPHAAAGAGAATNKQLVPKVISRCSPTQSTPTKINSNSPILSQSRAQLRPGTKAQEGHEVRPNQWNPIFFPKPPTPPTMVKDDSTLRKAAAITPPTKTPTKTSVLSYLHSPAGQKFLDNLERETLLKRKSSRPEFGASTSSLSPSAIAVDDRTQHDISLERRRKSRRDGVDSKIPNGSTSLSECQATRNRDCGRDTSVGHVATSAWSEDVCSQSPDSHFTGADAGSIRSSRVTTDADVFDSEGEYIHLVLSPLMFYIRLSLFLLLVSDRRQTSCNRLDRDRGHPNTLEALPQRSIELQRVLRPATAWHHPGFKNE
ncbi:hypothetical protein BDD12DRAFT_305107 [Trichophaea hybrida]|nr:hypothetical protein BDD12DRAFT_305107 [Trichophaea hybrida]